MRNVTDIYNNLCYPHGDRFGSVVVVGVGIEGKSNSGGTEARIGKQIIYFAGMATNPCQTVAALQCPATWPVRDPYPLTRGLGLFRAAKSSSTR